MSAAQEIQPVVLLRIHHAAPIIQELYARGFIIREISEKVGLSKSSVCRTLVQMRDAGMIERRAAPTPPEKRTPWSSRECGVKPVAKAVATLNCLRCRGPFQSVDRVRNRVCFPCRHSGDW